MNLGAPGGGGRRGRARRRAPLAEINVTPLVDVMLVLLIIFMVTAPLLNSAVPVDLPESSARPMEQTDEPIDVAIDAEGQVFIDSQPVADADLPTRLAAIAAVQDPADPRAVTLRGDEAIGYKRMMFVMGELNRAGLNKLNLVTAGSSSEN